MCRTTLVLVALAACGGKTAAPVQSPQSADVGTESSESAPACEPGRCLADISRLIAERKGDARACYASARARTPKLEGKIIINFAIDSDGVVAETSQGMQDGQLEDAELVTCLSEVIKTVRFAPSAAGKTTRAYHRFEIGG